ncbi:hypothetical protein EPO33_01145 [Patescibacteria group bacterium]|nr:MAG: hypothetical protein EPO33_01145 [Patescibacteria group bacterium]
MAFDKSRNGKHGVGGFHAVTVIVGGGRIRLFVLQPENGTKIHIVVRPEGALTEGDVLLPRWREWDDADPGKRELRHSRYRDLLSAQRGTLHAIVGYEPENGSVKPGELEKMLATSDTAKDALAYMRAVRRLEPADALHLKALISKLVEALDGSRLPRKQEALEQFGRSLLLKDRKGRSNVGALCARLLAGLRRVNGRVDDIRSIGPRLALQLMVLEQELTLHFRTCTAVEKVLRGAIKESELLDTEWSGGSRPALRIGVAIERLTQMGKVFHAEPFLSLRRRIEDQMLVAAVALKEHKVEPLRQALERARELVILTIERVELGAIHRDLSLLAGEKLPADLGRELENRLGRFASRVPELKGIEGLPYDEAVLAVRDGRRTLANGGLKEAKEFVGILVAVLEVPLKPVRAVSDVPQSAAIH